MASNSTPTPTPPSGSGPPSFQEVERVLREFLACFYQMEKAIDQAANAMCTLDNYPAAWDDVLNYREMSEVEETVKDLLWRVQRYNDTHR